MYRIFLFGALLVGCQSDQHPKKIVRKERSRVNIPVITCGSMPGTATVRFRLDTLKSKAECDSLIAQYSREQLAVILELNRLSIHKLRKGAILVLPDTILPTFRDYTTFPESLAGADTLSKLLLVGLRIQSFAAYESGKLVRCGPVSSGSKRHPTPSGLHHTNWRARKKISTVNAEWIMPWYYNIHNKGGIAFHQYELPGYPASHSCIRLNEVDAKWIYDWAEPWELSENGEQVVRNGTPVVIFGKYDFDLPPVWRSLAENPKAMVLTDDECEEIDSLLRVNSERRP